MQVPVRKRITTNTTTVLVDESRYLSQLVIAIAAAGSTWKMRIQDQASPNPFILIPETTLSAPSTPTAVVINFDDPIRMEGGIDVVTSSGTPGELAVWANFKDPPQQ